MKVLKSNGLVPVTALKGAKYPGGTQYGLPPKAAIAGVLAGEVELREPPPGVACDDVPGPDAVQVVPETAKSQPKPKKAAAAPDGPIDIPENWDAPTKEGGLQWMQQVKLAQQIKGVSKLDVPEGQKAKDVAADIIREEVKRRAAADEAASQTT